MANGKSDPAFGDERGARKPVMAPQGGDASPVSTGTQGGIAGAAMRPEPQVKATPGDEGMGLLAAPAVTEAVNGGATMGRVMAPSSPAFGHTRIDGRAKRENGGRRPLYLDRPSFDMLVRNAREDFVKFGDMGAAHAHTALWAKREFETRDTRRGLVLGPKAKGPLDDYVSGKPRQGFARVEPTDHRVGARAETPDVAARREEWDAAARAGDPDAMTRTANALIRAVTAAKAVSGEAHDEAHASASGERDAASEILAPQKPGRSIDAQGSSSQVGAAVANTAAQGTDVAGRAGFDAFTGAPKSNADVGPGEVLSVDADGNRTAPAMSDADLPPGWKAQAPGGAGSEPEGPMTLTASQAQSAADYIMKAPEDQRAEMLRQMRERFGETLAAKVAELLVEGSHEVPPDGDGLVVNDNTDPVTRSAEDNSQDGLTLVSYPDQRGNDYDKSGGNIGPDFDYILASADRAVPMGRIALERALGRSLTPVEVEALQAQRVLGRRLTDVERVELLSRNVVRGRLAEEATVKFFRSLGYKVWARNATIVTRAGVRRIDVVVRDKFGRFFAVESKAGGAARNAYQRQVDLEIERNGGVFVGERAGPLDGVHHRMGTIEMQIPGI